MITPATLKTGPATVVQAPAARSVRAAAAAAPPGGRPNRKRLMHRNPRLDVDQLCEDVRRAAVSPYGAMYPSQADSQEEKPMGYVRPEPSVPSMPVLHSCDQGCDEMSLAGAATASCYWSSDDESGPELNGARTVELLN